MCYLPGTYLGVRLHQESLHWCPPQDPGHITCTTCTSNIIYLISCRICGIQYISETKNSLKKRFYGHRSTVKTHKLDTPVGQLFNLPNHFISDTILKVIEVLANCRESVRLSREKMWIRRVHTIHPMVSTYRKGMTNSPFFLHRNFYSDLTFILHLFYICFAFLSDSLLFTNIIISSSSQNFRYLYSYLIFNLLLCRPGPVPDSAFLRWERTC